MQIHEIQKNTKRESPKRVGRGGTRGKTSGKGTKGQKARSGGGGAPRPYIREDIKRIPKRRGYGKNRARTVNASRAKVHTLNLSDISELSLKVITPLTLVKAGVIKKHKGKLPVIKILGIGDVKKAFKTSGVFVSDSAKVKIEKAGGSVGN